MTSEGWSSQPSRAEIGAVRKAILVTHGRVEQVVDGVARLLSLAEELGVELVIEADEAGKHGLEPRGDVGGADAAIVLGGDGTMLRALVSRRGSPVIGVNFGCVGFLCTIARESLVAGRPPRLQGRASGSEAGHPGGRNSSPEHHGAVNEVVATSSEVGRMVELEWAAGRDDLGRFRATGMCSHTGGLDRVQPLQRRPRPDVGDRCPGGDLRCSSLAPRATRRRSAWVLTSRSGIARRRCRRRCSSTATWSAKPRSGAGAAVRLGARFSLLGTLPDSTFVSRYRRVFAA